MDKVGDTLKEIAPAAEKAGVILGLEDTNSARDNVRIMGRTKSNAVLTYYDVGNSTKGGFDVVEGIRWLGGARICEVHLKDNPHYLGEARSTSEQWSTRWPMSASTGGPNSRLNARHRWRTACAGT
jgi:L-ribulose-5-phosphate 3-epimerase